MNHKLDIPCRVMKRKEVRFYLLSLTFYLLSFISLTNAVGRSISGEFVRCDERTVTIRTGKTERTIPFVALKSGERERILKAHGTLPPTAREKRVKAHLDAELAVIDAKEKGGWLSKDEADKRRAAERRNAEFQLAPKAAGNGER